MNSPLLRSTSFIPYSRALAYFAIAAVAAVLPLSGQAPALQWSTGVNGHVFAVDARTNSYSYTPAGAVVVCNAAGAITQTTPMCIKPGMAQRDAAGDFYFFGNFDGTNDFGGTTLVGGWLNNLNFYPPVWQSGWPTCFLAKYDGGGNLLWATNFGTQAQRNIPGDIALSPDGSVTVSYEDAADSFLSHYSADGANLWSLSHFIGQFTVGNGPMRLDPTTGTDGFLLNYRANNIVGFSYDSIGGLQVAAGDGNMGWRSQLAWNGRAVVATNTFFVAGLAFQNNPVTASLDAWQSGNVLLWSVPIGPVEQWVLAGDAQNNLYLAGVDGIFSKYDGNGVMIWSTNYGLPAVSMIVDASGNRFVSFNNGSVARLAGDAPALVPTITTSPQPVEAFTGDTVSLSVAAAGTPPLAFTWLFNGTNVSGANGSTLTLTGATSAQSGNYAAVVTGAAGSVTSAPAAVIIKNVELFNGPQMLTNGTYSFLSGPTLTIRSAFPNGEEYYTLDGSTPSFASIIYSGPFVVSNSATVKAIGYSSDFSKSEYADTATLTLPPQFLLSVGTAGGGTVTPGGLYVSNSVATVTATPAAGWTFLRWQGAVSSTSPTINVTMKAVESVQAVFGTTVSTTVAGNGQVVLSPPSGPYAFGSVVRVEGIPGAGNYFGVWGNAASGSANPLYFTVTNANPTVSSIFATIPANDVSLTTTVTGRGRVGANPAGNVFATGQPVTITATPDAGQSFLGWSGGATGTQNPLTITLNQSALVTANFTGETARLAASATGQTSGGFTLTLISDPGSVYQILVSTNLSTWQSIGTVTNISGQTQFTDSGVVNSKARFYRAQQ